MKKRYFRFALSLCGGALLLALPKNGFSLPAESPPHPKKIRASGVLAFRIGVDHLPTLKILADKHKVYCSSQAYWRNALPHQSHYVVDFVASGIPERMAKFQKEVGQNHIPTQLSLKSHNGIIPILGHTSTAQPAVALRVQQDNAFLVKELALACNLFAIDGNKRYEGNGKNTVDFVIAGSSDKIKRFSRLASAYAIHNGLLSQSKPQSQSLPRLPAIGMEIPQEKGFIAVELARELGLQASASDPTFRDTQSPRKATMEVVVSGAPDKVVRYQETIREYGIPNYHTVKEVDVNLQRKGNPLKVERKLRFTPEQAFMALELGRAAGLYTQKGRTHFSNKGIERGATEVTLYGAMDQVDTFKALLSAHGIVAK